MDAALLSPFSDIATGGAEVLSVALDFEISSIDCRTQLIDRYQITSLPGAPTKFGQEKGVIQGDWDVLMKVFKARFGKLEFVNDELIPSVSTVFSHNVSPRRTR
ncbi:hypothetical protein E1178_02840 [Roseibium hamelinense]|nr:hypothetical protein [Roseibium hamelinense]